MHQIGNEVKQVVFDETNNFALLVTDIDDVYSLTNGTLDDLSKYMKPRRKGESEGKYLCCY